MGTVLGSSRHLQAPGACPDKQALLLLCAAAHHVLLLFVQFILLFTRFSLCFPLCRAALLLQV
jgi:hypothetical protein